MKTICVQIGNSDDKLRQKEWFNFVNEFEILCHEHGSVHFSGASNPISPFQNYCVVLEVSSSLEQFRSLLQELRAKYKQDSLAWLEGNVEFV